MRIKRIINQNLKTIILVILGIIFVIAIIQTLNHFVKTLNKNDVNEIIEEGKNNTLLDSSLYPAISQKSTTDIKYTATYKNVIDKFLKLCNEKKAEEAYEMLSKECKEVLYSDYDSFYNNYYKSNFASNKSYSIQNWNENIFKVDIKEDILSTGGKIENNIQDFITVVTEDEQYKLNINNYIRRTEINKETILDNIVFKVTKKDTFMREERYYLSITNNGKNEVLLDNLQNTSSIYLLDSNKVQYPITNDKLTTQQLNLRTGVTMNISIKFTNSYITDRKLDYIVFSDVSIKDKDGNTESGVYKIEI